MYTIGNFIPSIANWKPGRGSALLDTFIFKLYKKWIPFYDSNPYHSKTYIMEKKSRRKVTNRETFDAYQQLSPSLVDLINNLFLQDFYYENNEAKDTLMKIHSDICLKKNNKRSNEEIEKSWKLWFEINTKLIIQRAYRIENSNGDCIEKRFTDKQKSELNEIFVSGNFQLKAGVIDEEWLVNWNHNISK